MFDIKEYYFNSGQLFPDQDNDLETEVISDVDQLLNSRFSKLYRDNRFKQNDLTIDILSPAISYTGNRSLILSSDRIRFLLSFYPKKDDLNKIKKIVIRPRHIVIGGIELASLYLKAGKILILYLSHPYDFDGSDLYKGGAGHFVSFDLKISEFNRHTDPSGEDSDVRIHPLWHMISKITPGSTIITKKISGIEKFLIRLDKHNDPLSKRLDEISSFYSRNGY